MGSVKDPGEHGHWRLDREQLLQGLVRPQQEAWISSSQQWGARAEAFQQGAVFKVAGRQDGTRDHGGQR